MKPRKKAENPKEKRKFRFFGVFLVIVSVGISLFGLELVFRVWGNVAMRQEKNGGKYISPYRTEFRKPWLMDCGKNKSYTWRCPDFTDEIKTNSEGMRDIAHPLQKSADEYRIVALGDSFTMGQGAPYTKTWPKVLERRLNADAAGKSIRVIMGGVAGSDPVFEWELFTRRLMKYKPDLVVQMINNSDFYDVLLRGGMDRFDVKGMVKAREVPRVEWIWARSHVARVFLMGIGYDWHMVAPWEKEEKISVAVATVISVAERFRTLGRRQGFDYLLVGHPNYIDVKDPAHEYFFENIRKDLSDRGIAFYDLKPLCLEVIGIGSDRVWEYYWRHDHHCRPEGYALFARGIENEIRERGFIPKR